MEALKAKRKLYFVGVLTQGKVIRSMDPALIQKQGELCGLASALPRVPLEGNVLSFR